MQSPEEQERQILEWVSKERFSGTVVRKKLFNWFAGRIHHRDGTRHEITSDFADEFLHHHRDLARTLIDPPPPEGYEQNHKRETGNWAADRLRERMQRDCTRAMFGDNPPPARQPAPFPDGDIIYHCNNRYVIRHCDIITKLTTNEHGFGYNDILNEALALRFVKAYTIILVPKVSSSD